MKKSVRYCIAAPICVGGVLLCLFLINKVYISGLSAYADATNADIEQKRQQILSSEAFHNGVHVNDVPIGGMSMEEAIEALAAVEESLVEDVGFTLYHEDAQASLTLNDFEISYNTNEILAEAMMLAREGELESLRQQIDEIANEGRYFTIAYEIIPKQSLISSKIRRLAEMIDYPPVDAAYQPNPESVFITDKTYEGIDDPTLLDDYISPERFLFVEEQDGRRAFTEKALDDVLSRTSSREYGTIEIETEALSPKVKLADLKNMLALRSYYESSYASGSYGAPNRVANIKKACGFVNGTILPPPNKDDENDMSYIFSTNDCLGDRTLEGGWLLAPGFVDGGANSEDSPGGGVCHVSSTLYNAVILADLNIVYRINHSSHVGYVPWGQDATIDTGRIDFKWSNNTEHNLYVFMWVDTKSKLVCCEIWGEPFPEEFDRIEFYAEQIEVIPPGETQYIQTSDLSAPNWYIFNDAKTGYKYQSYKQYYKDDKRVGRPVTVAVSEYRMHPLRIYVWRGFDPTVDTLLPEHRVAKPTD